MTAYRSAASDPFEVLDALDGLIELSQHFDRIRRFMLETCVLLRQLLPDRVVHALDVSAQSSSGRIQSDQLERERIACWNVLGDRSCDFADPNVNAVRAVICTLFPETDDAFGTTHAFLDFAIGAGVPAADLAPLLRSHFRDLVSAEPHHI